MPNSIVTADRSVIGTAFADVTDLTFPVEANRDYTFEFIVHYTTNATTTGARFAVNGPASPNALRVGAVEPTSASAVNFGSVTAYDTAIFATTAGPGATATMCIIAGSFSNGANAGTFALRMAAEVVSPGQVTVLQNSHGSIDSV